MEQDLTGQRFNHLVAIMPGPDKVYPSGQKQKTWLCLCDCQKDMPQEQQILTPVPIVFLKNGEAKSCGCGMFKQNSKEIDWNNHVFGKLKAIRKVPKPEHLKVGGAYWECECECGNKVIIRSADISRQAQLSCGKCRTNTFNLSGNFGIGYTAKNEEFYFDKEDYELVKQYSWSKTEGGYIMAWDGGRKCFIYMHRLLTGLLDDKKYVVDHMNHNTVDNQKENLRICLHRENIMNSKLGKNNKTGVVGVGYRPELSKWVSRIMVNYKTLHLGLFEKFEDAVQVRQNAEKKIFRRICIQI